MNSENPRPVQFFSDALSDRLKRRFLGRRQHAGHPNGGYRSGEAFHIADLSRIGHRPAAVAVIVDIDDAGDDAVAAYVYDLSWQRMIAYAPDSARLDFQPAFPDPLFSYNPG